jgi:hypothetical protein
VIVFIGFFLLAVLELFVFSAAVGFDVEVDIDPAAPQHRWGNPQSRLFF